MKAAPSSSRMESLCKFGACSEAIWPSDPHLALKKPGASAYEAARALSDRRHGACAR